jgi:hypothetical protein
VSGRLIHPLNPAKMALFFGAPIAEQTVVAETYEWQKEVICP